MIARRGAAVAVLAGTLVLASRAPGQEDPRRAAPTFGSDVEIVRLDVTVVDRDGRFVTALGEGDFELYEDGRRQALTSFVRQELPVSLVLLLDASISVADRMPQAQAASARFVQGLRPSDEVRVTEFNDRVAVLQESTSDRAALAGRDPPGLRRGLDCPLQRPLRHPEGPAVRVDRRSGAASSSSSRTARTPRRWCGRSRCSSWSGAGKRPST